LVSEAGSVLFQLLREADVPCRYSLSPWQLPNAEEACNDQDHNNDASEV
jgi:hypothetical protein